MRAALVLILLSGAASAQKITDFHTTPDIQTVEVGTLHCNVYGQHPAASQVQIACYLNGTLFYNAVSTIANDTGVVCSVIHPPGQLTWALIPAISPLIGYQLAAQAIASGPPLFFGAPPIAGHGGAATAGTF